MTGAPQPGVARDPLPTWSPPSLPVGPSAARAIAGLRLAQLYLATRRLPAALMALASCGAVLRAALYWHWIAGTDPRAQELPAIIEAAAACVIAITSASPFGSPERVTGRWLPYLRLGTAVLLAGAAVAALTAGAAASHLPGEALPVLRNVAGATGVGLLTAAMAGGALAWIGPVTYMIVAEFAIISDWQAPWTWPARPPHDHGAAIWAALSFAAGLSIVLLRAPHDRCRE